MKKYSEAYFEAAEMILEINQQQDSGKKQSLQIAEKNEENGIGFNMLIYNSDQNGIAGNHSLV